MFQQDYREDSFNSMQNHKWLRHFELGRTFNKEAPKSDNNHFKVCFTFWLNSKGQRKNKAKFKMKSAQYFSKQLLECISELDKMLGTVY